MSHYLVGIDLGTTHTVVAYAKRHARGRSGPPGKLELLQIQQLVAPGQSGLQPLLPSVRYHSAADELAATDVQLPWPQTFEPDQPPAVIGQWARQLGSQVPGRLVSSAKSWLSHPGVDRQAAILPWGAAADVARVSPVEASASYLRHVQSAWNQQFPEHPLVQQDIVLTVPASFDEAARALTLQAAQAAGLPKLRLLEEPQAVFYDWLWRHRDRLGSALQHSRLVLVCDVGGGTTDLSLIEVMLTDGEPQLSRIGVGQHLMLGGDNMDLALAHLLEPRLTAASQAVQTARPAQTVTADPRQTPPGPGHVAANTANTANINSANRASYNASNDNVAASNTPTSDTATAVAAANPPRLSAGQLAQLVERCRHAKELLLLANAPAQLTVTLLGAGARLIGGSRSASLTRQEVETLVVDGFFPSVARTDSAAQTRKGLVEFGLPYARDPAITRHIADFLRQHDHALPDTLLLNGGVFRAESLVARLQHTLADWRGAPLHLLHNDHPDLAVARGAVAYALAQHGLAPKIGGGSARSYFLLLDDAPRPPANTRHAGAHVGADRPASDAAADGGTSTAAAGLASAVPSGADTGSVQPHRASPAPSPLPVGASPSSHPVETPPGPAGARGICILPRGTETGCDTPLTEHRFALRLGQPVRFQLYSAVADAVDHTPYTLGQLVALDDEQFVRLPPIATVLSATSADTAWARSQKDTKEFSAPPTATIISASSASTARARGQKDAQYLPVQLVTTLTEVGTLALHCQSLADPGARWQLEFDLRHHEPARDPSADGADTVDAAQGQNAQQPSSLRALHHAREKIERVFGAGGAALPAKDIKQLRQQLEQLLGERERWATPELRQLFDTLWQNARGRKRSPEHERVWLNLSGYCLRPGFGDPLDDWRLQQLWGQFETGVQHSKDHQVCTEWWTLWRRVAGGLSTPQQLRLLDDFGYNLHSNERGPLQGMAPPVKGSNDDMLRLGAALERIPADYKQEIGQWLLARLHKSLAAAQKNANTDSASNNLALWALGRIGAREPLHATAHEVVPPEAAADWVTTLLTWDWKRHDSAAFAAVHIARVTDDRARDLSPELRAQISTRLQAIKAPPLWQQMLQQRVTLDATTERRLYGEALPPGLKLMA